MKFAVVGSRSITEAWLVFEILNRYNISLLISGGAKGIDSIAERYAKNNDIETLIFKADWDKYGKSAGFKRNVDIIDAADYVIAIWDGSSRGTKHDIELAIKNKKVLYLYTITPSNIKYERFN